MGKTFKWIEPSEKEIENAILEYLNYQVGCFAFKVNTMGVFDQRGGFYRKLSKHVVAGTPDIIACYNVNNAGVFVGMEVKSSTGMQSQDQRQFEKTLKDRSNGYYFIVRCIKDAENALTLIREALNGK